MVDEGLKIDKVDTITAPEPQPFLSSEFLDSRLTFVEETRKEVTAAPTSVARNFKQQLTPAKISGTYYLYVYFPDEGVYKRVTVS